MALDVGTKRIGVALSDYLQVIAIPSVCIPREPEKKAIEEIIKIAIKKGYKDISNFSKLKTGDKVYVTKMNKAIALF